MVENKDSSEPDDDFFITDNRISTVWGIIALIAVIGSGVFLFWAGKKEKYGILHSPVDSLTEC